MTIREAIRGAAARLDAAGVPDGAHDAAQLLAHVLGEDALMMRMNGHRALEDAQAQAFDALVARREKREPLQYIVGEAGFMGLTFSVAPGVLIPRADTEVLCEEALKRLSPGMRVLDIGAGPGTLSVSLAKLCAGLSVTAVDVSDTALEIAKKNAQRNGAHVRFVKSDLFAAIEGETFDLILSNPPYISGAEMKELMPEVCMEPELALFGGEDGLDFYRRICREAPAHLCDGGWLLFEIGWLQKDDVCALLRAHVGEPFALRDYAGNWRVVGAKKEKADA